MNERGISENGCILSFKEGDFLTTTDYPHPLQMSIMPLICKTGSSYTVLGTAFSIAPNIFLTAKHVVEEYVISQREELDNTGTVSSVLAVLYMSNEKLERRTTTYKGGFMPITQISINNSSDVASMYVNVPSSDGIPWKIISLRLSGYQPLQGKNVVSAGYSEMEISSDRNELDESKFNYNQKMNFSQGTIEELLLNGRSATYLNFPCFSFRGKSPSGMSGSPIFSEQGHIIGIVSDCMEYVDEESKEKEYLSHATLILSSFLNTINLDIDGDIKKWYIYQLIEKDIIKADKGFNNLSFALTEDGAVIKHDFSDFTIER